MNKTPLKIVRIIDSQRNTREVPSKDILSIKTSESIESYAGTFDILIDNTDGKNSKICDTKDEVEIWLGYEGTEPRKVMAGFIDRIIFEKEDIPKITMRVQGRSYSSVLLDAKVTGKIHYTEGYSQALRLLLKETPLKLDGVLSTDSREGTIIFRNTPLIDVVRQVVEEAGWTFRVDHDKVFHFKPFSPPKESGITLTEKDIKSLRFVKESK